MLIDFREGGREGEKKGEKHQLVAFIHTQTRDQTCNLDTYLTEIKPTAFQFAGHTQ